jgi:uncharacterized Tic20 family protein
MTSSIPSDPVLGPGAETTPKYTPTSDERTLAILCHVLGIFFWIFPPLIIYLIKKDESAYVKQHAMEALNFQITISIVSIVLALTIVGILLIWVVWIAALVFMIIASINASDNKIYRYPLTLRLIK